MVRDAFAASSERLSRSFHEKGAVRAARGPPNSPSRARESTGDAPRVLAGPVARRSADVLVADVPGRGAGSRPRVDDEDLRRRASSPRGGRRTRSAASRRAARARARAPSARSRLRARPKRTVGRAPDPAPAPPTRSSTTRSSRTRSARRASPRRDSVRCSTAVGALGVLFSSDMFRAFPRRGRRDRPPPAPVRGGGDGVPRASRATGARSDDAENRSAKSPPRRCQRSYYADAVRTFGKAGGFERLANLAKDSGARGRAPRGARRCRTYASSGPRREEGEDRVRDEQRRAAIASAWPWLWLLDPAGFRAQFGEGVQKRPPLRARA